MVAFLMVAGTASSESGSRARSAHDGELDRWILSAGIEGGVYGHSADGDFSGTPIVGPRATNINFFSDAGPNIVDASEDSADIFAGLVGPTFEVMTPAPFDIATQPRLFMGVSILAVLTQETSVVRLGAPDEYAIREPFPPRNVQFIGERILVGPGTQVTSQHQGVQLHIALGTALTFDWGEHRIRVKPSVEYSRTENQISAVANRAIRVVNVDPLTPDGRGRIRSLDHFRLLTLVDDFTEVYHGLGPALEIEYETDNRFGPFLVSLFLKGSASHIFGDLETEFAIENPEFPAESVRFKYKNDAWAYKATTGVRFRLVPLSK